MTDIADVVKKYPIGSKLKLSCDMPDHEWRTVQGYKQIGEHIYIIFFDKGIACTEKVAQRQEI